MDSSILNTIKRMLGLEEIETGFDIDIIVSINSAFMFLNQLGVGPTDCFVVTGNTETWGSFLTNNTNLEAVKSYIYLKVRMMFDPPSSSTLNAAFERQLNELEFRLMIQFGEGTTNV